MADMEDRVVVENYTEDWFFLGIVIKNQLMSDLNEGGAPFLNIKHVGSTSVFGLVAKPIIDMLIIIDHKFFNDTDRKVYEEALAQGSCQQGYHFRGDTGVEGRWTFKLEGVLPRRNVYIAPHGGHYQDSLLSLRNTLNKHQDLRDLYARAKLALARSELPWNYGMAKNDVIWKILRRAGWTYAEITAKEARCRPRKKSFAQYPGE